MRAVLTGVLLLQLAAGADASAQQKSILDGDYAPTPDGREAYVDGVAGELGEIVALAPLCGKRTLKWADQAEAVLVQTLRAPRHGIPEGDANAGLRQHIAMALSFAEDDARRTFVRYGAKEACKPLADKANMAIMDKWSHALDEGSDWSGAGGKP